MLNSQLAASMDNAGDDSRESARERAERHARERTSEAARARPWKVAVAVVFVGWVLVHAWLWHRRGIRPRLESLDSQLTVLRILTAGALLSAVFYLPLCYALGRLRGLAKLRSPRRHALGDPEHESQASRWSLAEQSAWLLPCLAVVVSISMLTTISGFLLGMGFAGALALATLLPWTPVLFLLRRAFPGGRGELVVAAMLLFVAVGLTQSVLNRGFYKWTYSFGSIHFKVPMEPVNHPGR